MKNEQNVSKLKYEAPELHIMRLCGDFLETSGGNLSENFNNDPFDSSFGESFL